MDKVVAVDAIIEKDGKLLLIRRAGKTHHGKLALPGGRIDPPESAEAAVVREAFEETGLNVEPLHILGVYSGSNIDPRGWALGVEFICKTLSGTAKAGTDASEILWFEPNGVPFDEIGFSHHVKVIKDYIKWKKSGGTYWMNK